MHFVFIFKALLFIVASLNASCQSMNEKQKHNEVQSKILEHMTSQYAATELSKCIDSNGETTGSINVIWQTSDSRSEISTPFITGFSGSIDSLQGSKIEFQALTATKLEDFKLPPVLNPKLFPYGSYAGFTFHFPFDEQLSGWSFLQVNGQRIKPPDVTGAQFLIPKYVIGGEYSTRYYLKIEGGGFHEFSCQPISDLLRRRLSTFQQRTGEKAYRGSRGKQTKLALPRLVSQSPVQPVRKIEKKLNSAAAEELLEVISQPQSTHAQKKAATPPVLDLRPIGRPHTYDDTYQHVRIYDCGENGQVDAIWKVRSDDGHVLNTDTRYITGFAADLKDVQQNTAFYFSTIELDSEPAFYSGTMPTHGSYYFPTLKFTSDSIKKNEAAHSKISSLKQGECVAAGTIYLPRSGLGKRISVSLALGKSLRGKPYQATANCDAVSPKLKHWFKNCLGAKSIQNANRTCNL